jgi:hypothetical protein
MAQGIPVPMAARMLPQLLPQGQTHLRTAHQPLQPLRTQWMECHARTRSLRTQLEPVHTVGMALATEDLREAATCHQRRVAAMYPQSRVMRELMEAYTMQAASWRQLLATQHCTRACQLRGVSLHLSHNSSSSPKVVQPG